MPAIGKPSNNPDGGPCHEVTVENRARVKQYAMVGVSRVQTALLIGIDEKTLKKYYDEDILLGKAQSNARVGRTIYQKAVEDEDLGALIWWTKTQMGWKEAKADDNININGSVNITHNIVGIEPGLIESE